MITMLKTFKIWIIATIAGFLLIFSYKKGIDTEQHNQLKGNLNALKKAKKSRDNLSDPDRITRLHNKYKR